MSLVSQASAPSNIALIKYMGKLDSTGNHPTNSSLSYSLDHLRTFVRISNLQMEDNSLQLKDNSLQMEDTFKKQVNGIDGSDSWQSLDRPDVVPFEMTAKGKDKYLSFFSFLKREWQVKGSFLIESANNFPADSGIASSASSFAALTLAAADLFQKINPRPEGLNLEYLSSLSRQGSGSSCRSLFSEWALWQGEGAKGLKDIPYQNLLHFVVVPDVRPKLISSSEAHRLVTNSPKFIGRIERAEGRLSGLLGALRGKNWKTAYKLVWEEFVDMHELFESLPNKPFSYRTEDSNWICSQLNDVWLSREDGPLVTMDAGSSVHALFRDDQKELMLSLVSLFKQKKYKVWSSLA